MNIVRGEANDMRRASLKAFLVLLVATGAIAQAQVPARTAETKSPENQAPAVIRPIPAEKRHHFEALQSKMQPPARAWVEQQARIEHQRTAMDLAALNSAVRQRFSSLNPGLSNMDIDSIVAIVMMECAQQDEADLQDMMNQMQAINAQKQAMRQLENEMNQAAVQMKAQLAKENAGVRCATALCESLPARLASMRAATSRMRRPVNLTLPDHPTYGDFAKIRAQLPGTIDSLSDLSQEQQMQLQMIMDRRAKMLEAISNTEKKMSDTANSIIANIK
jgi:hypothetical protein